MRIELGAEIIFPVHDGIADLALWHIPAPERVLRAKHRRGRPRLGTRRFAEAVAPLDWVALCGLEGWVYAYGPHASRGRCCAVCLERAPAVVRALPVFFRDLAPVVCVGCGMPLADYTPRCATCWDRRRRRGQRERQAA